MRLAPTSARGWWLLPVRVTGALLVLAALGVGLVFAWTVMPGASFSGVPPALDESGRNRRGRLERDVRHLAGSIGERSLRLPQQLDAAADFIEGELARAGWRATRQTYMCRGHRVHNLVADLPGTQRPGEIVLLGAHYDSVERSLGADDNASGVAVLLQAARELGAARHARTIRLVAFTNEEPPWFRGPMMGSRRAADMFAERGDDIRHVIILDAVGYFCEAPCQRYPPILSWFYPDSGDFIAFIGRARDWFEVRDVVGLFRSVATIPSEGLAAPPEVPGVDYSDHAEFWRAGYPGILVSDTPTYRNPHYHRSTDTPETVDYDRLARVTWGVVTVMTELAAR